MGLATADQRTDAAERRQQPSPKAPALVQEQTLKKSSV